MTGGDDSEAIELAARLATLLRGHTSRADEAGVLAMLDAASGPALAGLSTTVDWTDLLGDVDDHRIGPKNRTALPSTPALLNRAAKPPRPGTTLTSAHEC